MIKTLALCSFRCVEATHKTVKTAGQHQGAPYCVWHWGSLALAVEALAESDCCLQPSLQHQLAVVLRAKGQSWIMSQYFLHDSVVGPAVASVWRFRG